IVISLVAPFLYGKPVDVPVLGYVATLLIGEAKYVSFTPLYFLSYALIGVAVGTLYRRIADKRRFYLRIMPLCLLVVIVWWALVFNKFGTDITAMRSAMGYGYTHPNLWHVVASLAHIFLFAAIFYFVQQRGEKRSGTPEPQNVVAKQILYYSKHISKYYALHISTYFIVLGLHGYMGFTSGQCWLLTLLSMIVTEVLVRGYNALLSRRKGR
ncbi:MAG: hypothetical protein RR626_01605, partial [Anaerovoracaceae bacterium]